MNLQAYSISKRPIVALNSIPNREDGTSADQSQWRKVLDTEHQQYYLLNEATGETKWAEDLDATDECSDPPPVASDEIPPVTAAESLGESWVKCVDNSTGQSYWFNSTTGESKWDDTGGMEGVSGWCEYADMNGNQYFYNEVEICLILVGSIQGTLDNYYFR